MFPRRIERYRVTFLRYREGEEDSVFRIEEEFTRDFSTTDFEKAMRNSWSLADYFNQDKHSKGTYDNYKVVPVKLRKI